MWKIKTFLASPFAGAMLFDTTTQTTIGVDDLLGVLEPITTQFSVTTIVALLAGVIGIGIAFVFLWWGVRKGFGIVMNAVKKGKIKL